MSGIVGIFQRDGKPVESADIARMLDTIKHRGPDQQQVWTAGPIGLGSGLLITTPEAKFERLPLTVGNLTLTADARIDNRAELLATFAGRFRQPEAEITDSDLILAAYEKWGEQCVEYLIGDFAFAIWDSASRRLFCARDHMGVRPFFYVEVGSLFAFASEIKALLCLSEVPRAINLVQVGNMLMDMVADKHSTFYENLWRLPPGNRLKVTSDNSINLQAYWTPEPRSEQAATKNIDWAEQFRVIFTECVRSRLRGLDSSVGASLSGGLDSSSVVCVARDLLQAANRTPLETFSAVYPTTPAVDESPFINSVLATGQFSSHVLAMDEYSAFASIEQILSSLEEPVNAPNIFIHWNLASVVHKAGIRVLLDGRDGDTVVSHGMAYLRELGYRENWPAFGRLAEGMVQTNILFGMTKRKIFALYFRPIVGQFAKEGNWIAALRALFWAGPFFRKSRGALLRDYFVSPLFRSLSGRKNATPTIPPIIHRDFIAQTDLLNRYMDFRSTYPSYPLNEQQYHQSMLKSGFPSLATESIGNLSAAYQIESRHPFFDKRLVEFCLSVPPDQKIDLDTGWTRLLVRRALNNILPTDVQWRPSKTNIAHNLQKSVSTWEQARINTALGKPHPKTAEILDMPVLRSLYANLEHNQDPYIFGYFWKFVTLNTWLQQIFP